MRARNFALALIAAFVTSSAYAQQATVTLFSTGTDATYSGSVDASRRLPFGVDASGYFDVSDVDGASREDTRLVASRSIRGSLVAVYELRGHDGDAPNRFGVGFKFPCGFNAVVFPYGVDFDTATADEDGVTVQVNGSRKVGDWAARGVVDVTRRNGVTRYFGTGTASFDLAPRVAFVGEYRARTNAVGAVDRSVWVGVGLTALR